MKAVVIFACYILALNSYATVESCEIEGWRDFNYGVFTFKVPINDTFRGTVATFTTKNIVRMKTQEVKYLNATWKDQTLTFQTSNNFDDYEKQSSFTRDPYITLKIDCVCSMDSSKTMTFKLPILDNNNHSPILNKKRYDYVFGLTIPKDLELSDILPITATDHDVTNAGITFSIETNQYISIDKSGKKLSSTKDFKTILKTRQEIEAPFNKTFTLVVTDDGHPKRNVSVPLTIVVDTPEQLLKNQRKRIQSDETDMVHPPVFGKHLYFADYSSNHDFTLEEPILITYGAQENTQLKQKGYENYFKVQLEDSSSGQITVHKLMALPEGLLESTNIITMEIEGVNPGLNLPGRTALLIRLPSAQSSSLESKPCEVTIYSANNTTLPLVLFLLAVFCIVFINIYLAVMFVTRNKMQLQRA